jgi:hypothetical protein
MFVDYLLMAEEDEEGGVLLSVSGRKAFCRKLDMASNSIKLHVTT